jgi:hypothetical protein
MPFAKSENDRPEPPRCKDCDEEMVVTLSVPLSYAPGFEDVFYECPTCKAEVKLTAIPI